MQTDLFDKLRQLEELLHTDEVRSDRQRLDSLLHPEFQEIGRSGRRYNRQELLSDLANTGNPHRIQSESYELSMVSDGVALLTYITRQVDDQGHGYRTTLRCSLWVRKDENWLLRFHQGTPVYE